MSGNLCHPGGAGAPCSTHHPAVLPLVFLLLESSSLTLLLRSVFTSLTSTFSTFTSLTSTLPQHLHLNWLLRESTLTMPFASCTRSPSVLVPLFTNFLSFPCLTLSILSLAPRSHPTSIWPILLSLLPPGIYRLHGIELHLLCCVASLA